MTNNIRTWEREKGCCGAEGVFTLTVDDDVYTTEETFGFCCPTKMDAQGYLNDVDYVESYSPKKKIVAYLLWATLGLFGAHRYYVGKWQTGLLMSLTFGCAGAL